MEKILVGLLSSDKPEGLKKTLIQRIILAGSQAQDEDSIRAMFQTTATAVLDSESDFDQYYCKHVYLAWAKYNCNSLENFFTADFLGNLIEVKVPNGANKIWLVQESLRLLRSTSNYECLCRLVEMKAIWFIREHPQVETVTAFCRFLSEFQECVPKGDFTSTFCISLIHAVSTFSPPKKEQAVKHYIRNVSIGVGHLLKHVWSSSDPECMLQCLKAIFKVISFVDINRHEPSIALGGVVQYIPTEMITVVTKTTVADTSIPDANMTAALQRMIDWLNWPLARNIDQWIIAFLKGLAGVHKYTILINVTESRVEQVFEKLQYPFVQESAMAVLSHILLSFQHSPDPFHKIVDKVPQTVMLLKQEAPPGNKNVLNKLAELMHCLMQLYPGFPDLYEPVLEAIKDCPRPTPEVVKMRLAVSMWTAQQKTGTSRFVSSYARKSETGKTGLVNLGNTCYMNSVIQGLFMCDSFRRELLSGPPHVQQGLMVKLQYVFAYLATTQRAVYAPASFLKSSRPPWFAHGFQQDCSEFLKYLLDQLHEQELTRLREERAGIKQSMHPLSFSPEHGPRSPPPVRGVIKTRLRSRQAQPVKHELTNPGPVILESDNELQPTLIQRTFGGKVYTTYTCLTCHHQSVRTEMFTDIPLAFPDHNDGTGARSGLRRGPSQKSLAGGDSTASAGSKELGEKKADKSDVISLEDLIAYYLKPEKLQGDNQYYCDRCQGLQDGERTQQIIDSPEYLILTLLRFSYDIKTHSRSKIFTDVRYPKTLNLTVHPAGQADSVNSETYGLCAVVMHSGLSSDCGHYYCYARHSLPVSQSDDAMETDQSDSQANCKECDYLQDKWYLFNDNRVTYSSYSSFSNVTKRFAKDTAYVLMYKKIRPEDLESGTVDQNESIMPAFVDPPLRKDLRETVEKDNKLFLQEQELEGRSQALKRKAMANNTTSPSWYNWKDSDDNGGPPGSCGAGGGGGLGGLDTSGSRFVY